MKKFKIQSKSKSNPNQIQSIFSSSFFLCLQGQPELCGSYILAFLSSSISMVNLIRLVAASFSSLALLSSSVSTANLRCLLATTFASLSFLSNSISSTCFILLRVPRPHFSWFSVSETFSFPLVVFFCYPSCSILSFSFLSECLLLFSSMLNML